MDELGEESADLEAGDVVPDLATEEAEPTNDNISEEVETPPEEVEESKETKSTETPEPAGDDVSEEVKESEETDEAKENEETEEAETRTERQIKGEEFEGKTIDEMMKIEGMELIYGGAKSHGFDPCFYHPDTGLVVTDCKAYGSEDKPGYVQEVSAFTPDRIAPNMTKMLEDMDANEEISQETKDDVWQAFGENKGTFLVVGSDTTRMSENKQAELGKFTNLSDLKATVDSLRRN